jgi:exodeoxyribonuclease VII small subunit
MQPFEFETALKELEAITAWFESSDADLDQGLAKFERGMELAAALKEHLSLVENKIEKIKLKFDGAPVSAETSTPAEMPAATATSTTAATSTPAPAVPADPISNVAAAQQDFDRSFSDDEAKSNGEVPGDTYPRVGLFS